ncbi:hypothetical protein [Streptomyces enissocaesilis]|uniref:Uncharacterized protein n=1 Tax=Streptomyces enissocaesilis TaxID=332589 RepID=A0ABN3WVM1_9ACTN
MTDTTAGAVEPPLWPDDWATEPCGPDADEQAFLDLHGPQRTAIPGDVGRSPSRGRRYDDYLRGAETVDVKGGVL